MPEIASRELREDTSGVLHRVRNGEDVVVTHNGRAVARIVPVVGGGRYWIGRDDLARRLLTAAADPALRGDLDRIGGCTDLTAPADPQADAARSPGGPGDTVPGGLRLPGQSRPGGPG